MMRAIRIKQEDVLKRLRLMLQWEAMERIQDEQPYLMFGWYGFVPMVTFN